MCTRRGLHARRGRHHVHQVQRHAHQFGLRMRFRLRQDRAKLRAHRLHRTAARFRDVLELLAFRDRADDLDLRVGQREGLLHGLVETCRPGEFRRYHQRQRTRIVARHRHDAHDHRPVGGDRPQTHRHRLLVLAAGNAPDHLQQRRDVVLVERQAADRAPSLQAEHTLSRLIDGDDDLAAVADERRRAGNVVQRRLVAGARAGCLVAVEENARPLEMRFDLAVAERHARRAVGMQPERRDTPLPHVEQFLIAHRIDCDFIKAVDDLRLVCAADDPPAWRLRHCNPICCRTTMPTLGAQRKCQMPQIVT